MTRKGVRWVLPAVALLLFTFAGCSARNGYYTRRPPPPAVYGYERYGPGYYGPGYYGPGRVWVEPPAYRVVRPPRHHKKEWRGRTSEQRYYNGRGR